MRGSRLVATLCCGHRSAGDGRCGECVRVADECARPVGAGDDRHRRAERVDQRNRRRRAVGGGGEGSRNGSRVRPMHASEWHRQLPRPAGQRRRDHRRRHPLREPGRLRDGRGPRGLPVDLPTRSARPPSPATPPVGRRSCPAATASVPTAASSPSGNAAPTRPRWCSTSTAAAPVGPPRCARSPVTASRRSTTGAFTTDPPSEGGIFDVANPDNPLADYSVRVRAVLHR